MRRTHAFTALLLVAGTAVAGADHDDDSSLALGLGVAYEESIYTGVDNDTTLLPMVAWESGNFYIRGPELGYHIINRDEFQLSTLLNYRTEGYEASDSTALRGMAERKGAYELGLEASLENELGEWSATALADISGEHKGYELELAWKQRLELSQRWALTPEAAISYRSGDLNNYYFGVEASEATVDRAAYTAGGGITYELGLSADYMIDQQQQLRFGASYQAYGSEISDSSIVDSDNSFGVHALYLYRF